MPNLVMAPALPTYRARPSFAEFREHVSSQPAIRSRTRSQANANAPGFRLICPAAGTS